jgi:hypothetical protein
MNDSVVSTNSLAIGEEDVIILIRDLDIEAINSEVFKLYEINYGLDTTLALRKVQVLEAEDEVFQNYLECLKEAHDRFLSYIFQGNVFGKMQQNPMHSTDLQFGVPWEFNAILDELLDGTSMMNEEEYKMQMNLSLSQIPQGQLNEDNTGANEEEVRLLTEVDEQANSAKGSSAFEKSSSTSRVSAAQMTPEGMALV